jgi:anti-anti-sigma factor
VKNLEVEENEGILIARLLGDIDMANARDVGAQLTAAIPNSTLGVVLDLTGTTYLDSSGIQFVFDLAERLNGRQQQLRVAVPANAPIRRVLRVVELDQTVPMDTTAGEAEAAIRAKS